MKPLPEGLAHRKCLLLSPSPDAPSRCALHPRASPPGASSLCRQTLNRGFTYLGHRTQTGSYSRSLGALEALIRKETANDSVSGLWQLCSVYGPFTALGPGVQTVPLSGGGKMAPGKEPDTGDVALGPACPLRTGVLSPAGVGSGCGDPGLSPETTRAGLRVTTLPGPLGAASWGPGPLTGK